MDKETISIQMNSYEEGSIGQAVTRRQRNFKHLRLREGFLEEGMLEWNPDTRIKFCFQSGLCWLHLDQPKWADTEVHASRWGSPEYSQEPHSPIGSWSGLSPGLASESPSNQEAKASREGPEDSCPCEAMRCVGWKEEPQKWASWD